jgi:CubicO group peptidase (beta-lactamase class C family)
MRRFAACVGLMIAVSAHAEPPPRDSANASFWDRYDSQPEDPLQPPKTWYRPVEAVAGAPEAFLPAGSTISPQALDDAAQFVGATAGDALIVLHRGKVVTERYFRGTSAKTVFSSHSMAKTLNALAIGAAIAEGKIESVDAPAATWITEWRHDARKTITIRQLLTMSSGFKTPFSRDPGSHYIQLHWGSDVEKIVAAAPLAQPPGSGFAYDNDNNHALGLVIERATGVPYHRYLSQRIWSKIGADNAEILFDRPNGRAMAYCCLLARPRDWARVGQMMLDNGRWRSRRLVPSTWISEMRKPSVTNANFGMQLFLGAAWRNPQLNRRAGERRDTLADAPTSATYYLSGAGGIMLMIVPEHDLVILRVGEESPGWREHVVPNLLVATLEGRSADYGWLFPWRMAVRRSGGDSTFDNNRAGLWPLERVAGRRNHKPLPRRRVQCLTQETLAPVLGELDQNGTYAFLVWHDGAIAFERYWPGYGSNVRAESASMHKSVLALVVGQAVADGSISSIDLPVSTWLTEWRSDQRGEITVRNLLEMASGLAATPTDPSPTSTVVRSVLGHDFLAVPLSTPLADPPGSSFAYLSGASQLLGEILERATGQRYAAYLSRRLWRPLGAEDAYVALDRPGGRARTSATLLAVPEDWVRLGTLFVSGVSKVVDPAWIRAMTAPSGNNPNYGFQIWRAAPHLPRRRYNAANDVFVPATDPFSADDIIYFDGSGGQRVYASASRRLVIVRIGRATRDWDDSRIPNRVTAALDDCSQ